MKVFKTKEKALERAREIGKTYVLLVESKKHVIKSHSGYCSDAGDDDWETEEIDETTYMIEDCTKYPYVLTLEPTPVDDHYKDDCFCGFGSIEYKERFAIVIRTDGSQVVLKDFLNKKKL